MTDRQAKAFTLERLQRPIVIRINSEGGFVCSAAAMIAALEQSWEHIMRERAREDAYIGETYSNRLIRQFLNDANP